MNAKNNRVNHDFQIVHFLVGSCHTPDGAYALLCDLHEDRTNALNQLEPAELRTQAKMLRANRVIEQNQDQADVLLARAEVAEIDGWRECNERNIAAAKAELAFIEKCMATIDPHRKWRDLPLPEAHEAAQREEWAVELLRRAENFLLTQGTIPADEFNTMRCHPDFEKLIYPEVTRISEEIKGNRFVPSQSHVVALLAAPE